MNMKLFKAAIFFLALGALLGVASAQTHKVTLTWTASADSTASNPGTANVYRATAACPASGTSGATFVKLASGQPAGGPYTDTSVVSGDTYCYYVTAVIGGAESSPSNTFQGVIPLAAPTGLAGVVQ